MGILIRNKNEVNKNIPPENKLVQTEISFDPDLTFPTKPICQEGVKGCSHFANMKFVDLTNGNVLPVAEDAWFQREHNKAKGGLTVYDKGNVVDFYSNFQIGDYVEFDRQGNPHGHEVSKINPNYKNTGSEHEGIIVGFNNGIPIVEHSSKGDAYSYRTLLTSEVHSPWGLTYTPRAVFRNPTIVNDNSFLTSIKNEKLTKLWNKRTKGELYKKKSSNKEINKWEDIYANEVRDLLGRDNEFTPDQLDEIFHTLIGLGIQESNLNNDVFPERESDGTVLRWLMNTGKDAGSYIKQGGKENLTNIVSMTKRLSRFLLDESVSPAEAKNNAIYNKKHNLKPYPGKSVVQMNIIKYEARTGKKLTEDQIKEYNESFKGRPENAYEESIIPSVGAFKAKITANKLHKYGIGEGEKGRVSRISSTDNSYYGSARNQLINSMLLLMEGANVKKYNFNEALDRSVIKYNAPGKEKNKAIMDFYYYGKENPDHTKYNIDYLTNIKAYKNQYFNE